MQGFLGSRLLALLAGGFIATVSGACVPDYPEKLLADPAILKHPAVVAAFEQVGRNLSSLYNNTTRDGLSFAVVSVPRLPMYPTLTMNLRFMPPHQEPHTHSTMVHRR